LGAGAEQFKKIVLHNERRFCLKKYGVVVKAAGAKIETVASSIPAQQRVQPTCGTLRDFQVIFSLRYFSALE